MNKSLLLFTMLMLLSSFCFGIDTLGISSVNYISNDPDVEGSAFLVTGVAGFDKTGKILASQLTSDEGDATKDFVISIENEKYSCDYSFVNKNLNPIINYRISSETKWLATNCVDISLSSNDFLAGFFIKPGDIKYRCVIGTNVYNVGAVSEAQENFELNFVATNGDETVSSSKISSDGITSARLKNNQGDNLVYVKWAGGGLKTRESCPSASTLDYIAIQNVASTSTFSMIDDAVYNNYKNIVSQLEDRIESSGFSESDIQEKINEVNSLISNVPIVNIVVDSTGSSYSMRDIVGVARKRIDLSNPFTLPVFTLKINADYVGIIQNVGNPSILSASSLDIQSGVGKYSDVVIKNIGSAEGTFRTSDDCDNEVFSTTDVSEFRKGETKTIKLFFNSNTVVESTVSCIITTYDISKSENRDSKSISVATSPVLSFEDGYQTCFGDKLTTYKDNQPSTVTCPNGCEVTESGSARCIPDSGLSGADGDGKFNTALFVVSLILGVLAGLIGYGWLSFVDNKIARVGVSILLGILVFIVVAVVWATIASFISDPLGFLIGG